MSAPAPVSAGRQQREDQDQRAEFQRELIIDPNTHDGLAASRAAVCTQDSPTPHARHRRCGKVAGKSRGVCS